MKLRIEGSKEEINSLIGNVTSHFHIGNRSFQVKSISKFYPNDKGDYLNKNTQGRVYVEVN